MDADPKTLELDEDAPRRSMQRLVLHSSVTLYLGDCRDILEELPQDAAVVTDPPYPGREDLFATDGVWDAVFVPVLPGSQRKSQKVTFSV